MCLWECGSLIVGVAVCRAALFGRQQEQASLLSLEQSLEPAVRPPKPLEGLVKSAVLPLLKF